MLLRCCENLYHLWSYLRVMLQLLPNEPCTSWHSFLFSFFFLSGNCMCKIKYCSHLLLPNLCTLFGNLPPFGQCILCSILSDLFFFFSRSTFLNSRVKVAMHQTFFLWGLSLAWVVYDILLQNYLKTVLAGCYWVRLHVWSLLIVDCL